MNEEKGYLPEKVNADENTLFWGNKMSQRTFTSKEEKQAPGFKAGRDGLTILFLQMQLGL